MPCVLASRIYLAAFLALSSVAASASEILTLDAAVAESLSGNPGLASMRARAEAAAAIPSQVGTLPDPSLQFRAINMPVNSFDFNQEAMTQIQFGISQTIPYPGKLALRERSAQFQAKAAAAAIDEFRLRLARDVKTAWWELFYLDRAFETLDDNQRLLRGLIEIAQTKYKVGQGLQQDVLLASLELSKLLDREIVLTATRRTVEARLNALLDRPTDGAIALPREAGPADRATLDETRLLDLAADARPLITERRRQIDAARARHQLARKDYYPDFKLSGAYGVRGGHDPLRNTGRADFLTLGIAVTVPLHASRRQAKAVEQRGAETRRQELALVDALRHVEADVSSALAKLIAAREQTALLENGIIPQARQTLEAMRAAYLVNKVDFLNLVTAQLTLNDYQTRYWRALSAIGQAQAALIAAVGQEMTND